jgi:hypothetical protein
MKRCMFVAFLFASLIATPVMAGDQSLDAAVGGAIGGGVGALIGNEVGGRDGAIVGGALGAAAGAAVATEDDRHYRSRPRYEYRRYQRPHYYGPPGPPRGFCPPGQAKKGRCW